MRLQNNLRPFLVAGWSPTGHLSKPDNGDYSCDASLFGRSAVFNCNNIKSDDVICPKVAATFCKVYACRSDAWVLDLVGSQGSVVVVAAAAAVVVAIITVVVVCRRRRRTGSG